MKKKKIISLTIRIPEELKETLDKISHSEFRSLNNQIIYFLEMGTNNYWSSHLFKKEQKPS